MGHSASFGNRNHKARSRARGVPAALFYGMFTVLIGANALTGTALLMTPDIARLLNGQNEQALAAYEDRIAQMRVEIDRLQSRSYAQAGDINLQLQELSQQQDVLLEQHQLVRALVDKADQLGLAAADFPALPAAAPAPAAIAGESRDIAATSDSLARMASETQLAMTGITEAARRRTQDIVAEMELLGIDLDLPRTDSAGNFIGDLPDSLAADLAGVGGPLLPASAGDAGPMLEDANAAMAALIRYKAARASVAAAPVHMPISGKFRQSSRFGNRTDPFTGRSAFHSGLDFAAAGGTTVFSAATGVVSFAGPNGGYGKMVEVTHADGLITRYAHLSAFLVDQGQAVTPGTPIARVGSTGRSTGPHLHFEIRKADRPLDPKDFLDAGKRLREMLG